MRVLMLILAIILFLSSCAKPKIIVDPQLAVYVQRFEQALGKKTRFSIQFGKLDEGLVGVCIDYGDNVEIKISDYHWPDLDEAHREEVMFHELGHCELGRGHVNGIANGRPISVMYPMNFGDEYAEHRDYYIKELIDNRVYTRGLALPVHDNYDGDYQKR